MEIKKNITPEAMEQVELDTQKKQTQDVNQKFDTKNYLNVRLDVDHGEYKKELKIRLLPIDKDATSPFKKIHMHTLKVNKKVSESGWKSYICLEKTDEIDHEHFGNKCPFCELAKEAWKNYKEETDEIKKEKWKDIFKENVSSEVGIIRCIERDHEEDGPKFWKFNLRSDEKDPMHTILELYKTRRQENIDEGDEPGNILDIYNGKDLKITVNAVIDKQGKATNKTSISITDYGKCKPISDDEEQINKWVNDDKKWSDVFVAKPYEYLSIVMDGKVPYFNKANNKWVMMEETNNNVTEDEIHAENAIMNAASNAKKLNNQSTDVDSELPF